MLGLIKRNFRYLDEKTFLLLHKSLVRSHLELGIRDMAIHIS